jgi:hypothetical protein
MKLNVTPTAASFVVSIAVLLAAAQPAFAGGKVNAEYTASLAGIPIGKGTWIVEIGENSYSASANGGTAGMLKMFATGQGAGSVRGSLSPTGQPTTSDYISTVKTEKKTDEVKVLINAGVVKDFSVQPPVDPDPERIAVTEAHRRGVTDPLTATLVRVPGNGNALGPEACRPMSVFDGRTRYDIGLTYKRIDQVKSEKGYSGPVVVCSIAFKPIAGFIMSRTAVKYLQSQRDMEVTLAPVAGTRVVIPYKVSIPTPIGLAVLEATQFVSTVRAAENVKSQ